ncbi:MAG: hypothetical protein COA90_01235 [Gammaproteobacteria bacterium]|nr:MAG: hypothetical protein COA90_01235 [Gammaproteobacteria bacterium]
MKLDTLCLVETPEGTDLHAEVVGLVPRVLAYAIDLFLRGLVLLVVSIILGILGKAGYGISLIIFFLLEWWYPVVFEVYRGGQTIGKKAFKIKVVNDDLTPIRLGPSLTRNLLRVADFFPSFYVVGIISMMVTKRFQRLGDLAANTIVIYKEERQYDTHFLEDVTAITPVDNLTEVQQIAFINFALNRGQLSSARQDEVAEIIRSRIPARHQNAADYVRGVGKWLLGGR